MSKVAVIAFTAFSSQIVTENTGNAHQLDWDFYRNDLVVELVVECSWGLRKNPGQGLISYSRIDKLYCTPKANCYRSARLAIAETCN